MRNTKNIGCLLLILFIATGCVGRTPVDPPGKGYYKNKPVPMNYSYDETWDATLAALERIGWKVEASDKDRGTIELAPSFVYNPSFAKYSRVYDEPLNAEIERSKMKSYLRRISNYEKITPPQAPPNPQFTREELQIKLSKASDAETQVRADYLIFPYHDYKIGYLGGVKSNGTFEKQLFRQIDNLVLAQRAILAQKDDAPALPDIPPPPAAPSAEDEALADIFFDYDSFAIRPDAEAVLAENFDILRKNPEVSIIIEGYADVRGTDEYNLNLAQRRADAARDYLVKLGVSPERIATVSKGRTEKFAEGSAEESYQLNRRAYFISTKRGIPPAGARIFINKEIAVN